MLNWTDLVYYSGTMLILYAIKITLITGMAVKGVKPERFAARVIYDGSSMVNLVAYIGWLIFGSFYVFNHVKTFYPNQIENVGEGQKAEFCLHLAVHYSRFMTALGWIICIIGGLVVSFDVWLNNKSTDRPKDTDGSPKKIGVA